MADSVVEQILALMTQQGNIEANRIKEEAAWKQEIKRAKNAWKGNTLKALAAVGLVAANFIPGAGPFISAAGSAALGAASKKKSPGYQIPPASGMSAGPMAPPNIFQGDDSWQNPQGDPYNPWDDEPI